MLSLHITFQSPLGSGMTTGEYTPENCASRKIQEASGEIQGPQGRQKQGHGASLASNT